MRDYYNAHPATQFRIWQRNHIGELTSTEILVLWTLLDYMAPGKPFAYPTQTLLQERTALGMRAIQYAISSLKAKGLIRVTRRFAAASLYEWICPHREDAAPTHTEAAMSAYQADRTVREDDDVIATFERYEDFTPDGNAAPVAPASRTRCASFPHHVHNQSEEDGAPRALRSRTTCGSFPQQVRLVPAPGADRTNHRTNQRTNHSTHQTRDAARGECATTPTDPEDLQARLGSQDAHDGQTSQTGQALADPEALPGMGLAAPATSPTKPARATRKASWPGNAADCEEFMAFYRAYPRKVGRQTAYRAWKSAIKRTSPEILAAAATRYAADPNLPEARFIPHPSTWLNGDYWANETPEPERVAPNQLTGYAAAFAAARNPAPTIIDAPTHPELESTHQW